VVATLQFYFLGALNIRQDGQPLPTPPTLKSQSLLAYLVFHRHCPHPRDRLAGLFWSDRPEPKARRSLSTALWHIRRCLPSEGLILSNPHAVRFDPQADFWLDVEEFESQASRDDTASLQRAASLYRGDFLSGFYDDWIINERYRLETLFFEVLARLMVAYETEGRHEAALTTALRLLSHDPLREDAHRTVMRAYGRLGQRNAALEQYRRCQQIVSKELGAEPMVETTELYHAILKGRFPVERRAQVVPVHIQATETGAALRSPLDVLGSSPLVGREQEMSLLIGRWHRAEAGQGALVLIRGESGIGKTRLAEELCHYVRHRGGWVVKANCYEHEHALPYGPLADILRGAIAVAGENPLRRLSFWQVAALARLAPELQAHLPVRSQQVLPTESEQTRLFNALTFLLLDLAPQNPLLLVLEDLQWAHDSTLAWLHHLARHLPAAPLLSLATYRPGEIDPDHPVANLALQLAQQGLAVRLRLSRLTREDLARWMEGASTSVVTDIYRHTEGNPFFILETQRALLEEGQLRLDEGRWVEATAREGLPIPDSVRHVIEMRLRRLSAQSRRALGTASVIGRTFDLDVLERVWGQDEETTLEALDELLRRRLLREGSGTFSKDYEFDHHLVRDMVYERLPRRYRQRWHQRVAEALVDLHGDEPAVSGEVAYHYIRAEDWANAQAYLFEAGDQAGRMAADSEALAYYRQALAAYERAFGDRWEPLHRAILERKMGESFFRAGEHARALDHLQKALAYLGRPLPTSRGAVRREILAALLQQLGRRLQPTLFSGRSADQVSPAVVEEVHIYSIMGWIHALLADYEPYLLVSLRALNISERERFARGEAIAATALGTAADFVPLFRLAGHFHRRAARAAEQFEHPGAVGFIYQGLAYHHYLLGEPKAALRHAQRSAAAYREADDPHRWALATLLTAYVHEYRGDFARALACAQALVDTGKEVGDLWMPVDKCSGCCGGTRADLRRPPRTCSTPSASLGKSQTT